ncbi:MAG TPA: MFS transporter [Desulfuromonadales bacterium]|nr:MFS transporter [Desulfuromonadales bacterium]
MDSKTGEAGRSPFDIPNVRLFIAFRVFFNARFYYPVFTILFLDFGLSLSQFAILNAIWAAVIVCSEVPSGALADTFGRRNLLVFSGLLMVVEIGLLLLVPRGNPDLLFGVFIINRILSGLAEAGASGADEALAYDSLKQAGDVADWSRVLERQIQAQSIGFVFAMALGGAVYDLQLMQSLVDFFGLELTVTRAMTLRIPIALTLIMALLTLMTTLRMREVAASGDMQAGLEAKTIPEAFRLVFRAGGWILRTPFVLIVILFGLLFDSVIRMLLTMNSQYYRLIGLPEAVFGIIGSGVALLGFVVPVYARYLADRHTPVYNLGVVSLLVGGGLVGMTFFWPVWGLLPALLLFATMYFVGFFVSHYLNRATGSEQRATVLSFKGLFFNLGYGLIGLLYSLLLAFLRRQESFVQAGLSPDQLQDRLFIESLAWFPGYFVFCLALLLGFSAWKLRKSDAHLRV